MSIVAPESQNLKLEKCTWKGATMEIVSGCRPTDFDRVDIDSLEQWPYRETRSEYDGSCTKDDRMTFRLSVDGLEVWSSSLSTYLA